MLTLFWAMAARLDFCAVAAFVVWGPPTVAFIFYCWAILERPFKSRLICVLSSF